MGPVLSELSRSLCIWHANLPCTFTFTFYKCVLPAAFILGSSDFGRSGTPQSQFTFPSLFNIVPSAAGTCADGNPLLPPAPGQSPAPITGPMPCGPADLPTGLTCKSAACGRPADWPEGEPFFLNLDLHDPATWQAFGLGLPAARLLQGQTGAELLYSQEELVHLTVRPPDFAPVTAHRRGECAGTPLRPCKWVAECRGQPMSYKLKAGGCRWQDDEVEER